ncbi:hypothetical protein GOQ27_13365 [Clostridium sp. D2Q-11]|uniref:Uncharacterized protein n=1 Tax=Anaeromonas frigoriresistens TaxID=2683708 RepID=A0A942UUF8_9FIRM|nr:hypothetical protein [Anaeromonas frigoriresistens]MBS4539459.1 hypothetical protein [Anaeromonas frigoriresistens]
MMNSNKKVTLDRADFDSIYCHHCKKAIGLIRKGIVGRMEFICPICKQVSYLENMSTTIKIVRPVSLMYNTEQNRKKVKEQFLGIPTRKEKEKIIDQELKSGKIPF